jgi:hypothetical protein
VNLNVTWAGEGQKWGCNLCGMENDTPPWYYCALDGQGQRRDRHNRPELQLGSVDFLVNEADYCERPLQDAVYVFAVDVSTKAVNNGTTLAALRAVQSALETLRELEHRYNKQTIIPESVLQTDRHNTSYRTPTKGRNPSSASLASDASADQPSSGTKPVRIFAGIITFDRQIQYYSIVEDPGKAANMANGPVSIHVMADTDDPVRFCFLLLTWCFFNCLTHCSGTDCVRNHDAQPNMPATIDSATYRLLY